jgi:hypothetical protein
MIKKVAYMLAGMAFLGLFFSPLFIKVHAECRSQTGECPAEITAKLEQLKGKNLFQVRSLAAKVLKSNYLVSDFSMQFKLPDSLVINTIIKKPRYSIFNKSTGKYYLFDEKGTILSLSDSSALPVVAEETSEIKVGDTVSQEQLFGTMLLEGLDRMYQIRTGLHLNDTLVVDMPSGIRVIFPLRDSDRDLLLGSLRLVYSKVTTDYPGKFSQIDMRYKNPVLR